MKTAVAHVKLLLLLSLLSACPHLRAQAPDGAGSLDYFFEEAALWEMPAPELAKRLLPDGYVKDPVSEVVSLGTSADLMKRNAHLFKDVPVWQAGLEVGTTLNAINFKFIPPENLALTLTKAEFKALTKKIEEGINAKLKVKAAPHPYMGQPTEKIFKATCSRWVGSELQCVFRTLTQESGGVFKILAADLLVGKAWPKGEVNPAIKQVAKVDRATGLTILEGMPLSPDWPAKHAEFAVLEQALACAGARSDRNAIRECSTMGSPWANTYTIGIEHIVLVSGAKLNVIVTNQFDPTNLAKLQVSCVQAAKKLGKNAPQKLQSLLDAVPEVLRAARATPTNLSQFSSTLKQAIASGKPLFYVGLRTMYPETNTPPNTITTGTRLIIGYNEKTDEVIFADKDGKPEARMKLPDAFAASYYVAVVTAK